MLTLLDLPQAIKTPLHRSADNHTISQTLDYCRINRPNNKLAALVLTSICLSPVTFAEQADSIAITAGVFDISDNNDDEATELGIEYRFAPLESTYNLIPTVGFTANSDEAYWLYGGVRYDISLSEKWVLTPHWAVSLYEEGDSTDLGSVVEFRSGLELAYKLNADSHLGLGVYHLSNAGIDDINPGSDSIILSYSFSPSAFK
ncbi:MAG: acyloxyacyl hydrolase [Amphritea sp.]